MKGVDIEAQRKWFKVINTYLSQKSSKAFREKLAEMVNMPKPMIDSINETIEKELMNNNDVKAQLCNNLKDVSSIKLES